MSGVLQNILESKRPAVERTKQHKLLDIILIAICGSSACDSWVDIELLEVKVRMVEDILTLPNGIPHTTHLGGYLRRSTREFEKSFMEWVQAINELTQGR